MEITLRALFNQARQTFPGLLADAEPLAKGKYGLVAETERGTLRKMLFAKPDPVTQGYAEQIYQNELSALRLLNGNPIDGVAIPVLLNEQPLPGSSGYFACYEMTKVPGVAMDWKQFVKDADAVQQERHFTQAGKVLADFHAAMASHPESDDLLSLGMATVIPRLTAGTDEINDALQKADRHFRTFMPRGPVHGDYHGGNILVDDQYNITGLIDFGVSGPAFNQLIDFRDLPDTVLPHALYGYEQTSGTTVDRDLLTLTKLSMAVGCLNWIQFKPEHADEVAGARRNVNEQLEKSRHITGLKSPAPL